MGDKMIKKTKKLSFVLAFFIFLTGWLEGKIFDRHELPKGFNPAIEKDPLKRRSSYPFISGDTFRAFSDFIIDETQVPFNTDEMLDGDTIFVNTDFLDYFFSKVEPFIQKKFILVTHNSIRSVPGTFVSALDNPKIVAWFGKNAELSHPKMRQIPIGLANNYWPHGNTKVAEEFSQGNSIEKSYLLYLNLNPNTNPDRLTVEKRFSQEKYCYVASKKPFKEYLLDLKKSVFVLSPEGAGIDCHRTWEALLVGSIPIIKHSILDNLFVGLSVLFIEDWDKIDEAFLTQRAAPMLKEQEVNVDKLYAPYWLKQIKKEQDLIRYGTINVPSYFGVNFDFSMEQTSLYSRLFSYDNPSWAMAKSLYRKFAVQNCDYSQSPRIPKIIHQIWLGSPFPDKYNGFRDSWLKLHPDWEYKLWTQKEIDELGLVNKDLYDQSTNYGEKSDIARYEILYRFGGLYIDTDFECLKSFDFLHHIADFYTGASFGKGFSVFNGLIGAAPGCRILKECIDRLRKTTRAGADILYRTGPYFFTKCIESIAPVSGQRCLILPVTYFYSWPWLYREQSNPEQIRPWLRDESFAIHYWEVSWNGGIAPTHDKKDGGCDKYLSGL